MRSTPALLAALLLTSACKPDDEPVKGSDDVGPDAPTEYIYDDNGAGEPTLTLDEIADAIEDGLHQSLQINAGPLEAAYATATADQDTYCPNYYSTADATYWYDSCTTTGGTNYSGYGFLNNYNNVDIGGGIIRDGFDINGAATIRTGGNTLELGGSAANYHYVDSINGAYESWENVVYGTFSWDGPQASGTWLEEDVAPNLYMGAYLIPLLNGKVFAITGGVGGLSGDVSAISFGELVLGNRLMGWPCAAEPAGMASVRAKDGTWYDVQFDVYEDGENKWRVDPDLCDGCGTAFFRGEPLDGEVCIDASEMLDWTTSPW